MKSSPPLLSPMPPWSFQNLIKNRYGVLVQHPSSKDVTYVFPNPGSVKWDVMLALLKVLVEYQTKPAKIFYWQTVHFIGRFCAGLFLTQRLTDPHYQHCASHTRCLKSEDWALYLSHIRSYSKLPRILTWGNELTDAIILTTNMGLLKQTRALHQQFHQHPQNLHRLHQKLPASQCKNFLSFLLCGWLYDWVACAFSSHSMISLAPLPWFLLRLIISVSSLLDHQVF